MVRMRVAPRRTSILLLLATVTAALVFHDVIASRALDAEYDAIEGDLADTIPSMLELSAIRRGLDQVYEGLGPVGGPEPFSDERPDFTLLGLGMEGVERHVRAYARLPASAAERGEQQGMEGALERLRDEVRATQEAPEARSRQRAREAALVAHESLRGTLASLVDLNLREAREREHASTLARNRANRAAVVTLGGIVILVLVLGVVVERQLRAADREAKRAVDEVDALAARLAADLGTPLTASLVALGVLRRDRALGREERTTVRRAEEGVRRAVALADAFLALSRALAAETTRPGDVASIDVVTHYLGRRLAAEAEAIGARLVFEPAPGLSVAMSDAALATILGTLVRNGLRYLGASPVRMVSVTTRAHAAAVVIEVHDTGPPVPPPVLAVATGDGGALPSDRDGSWPHTDANEGYALALASVSRLVGAYGGRIYARSEPGDGTTFTLGLPRGRATGVSPDEGDLGDAREAA
jgi:signal transduction histidine kinase